ncbi:integral membrane protein [Streptomyces sviceus ATCC 29083]|uniref:Integral membrane protein n=1 Tax=Streptomyces sviceus (strain ATCC 29083 / DSM 924 / JCM 4929 / NBRC 13980 / NCIMB 11184 / NRRL 5439 / UC 5370) TaxID=463191 RepID=B5HS48_STRX2|nr:integral membrane protein [Streptomyces sviceus ATCC 29083]
MKCLTALRFTVAAHLRNRLALVLAITFVPTWILVVRACAYGATLHFHEHAAGGIIAASNNRVTQVNSALNAVTVITGFMMFMEAFKSGPLDRRLVLAGFPRRYLMAGRVFALVVVAAVLAVYTAGLLELSWHQDQFGALVLAIFAANTAYGGIGLLLATLLRGELEGFFVIIMLSLMDAALQNPGMNPLANQWGLRYVPMYTASQSAYAASFTHVWPGSYLAGGLVWFIGCAAGGLLIFALRTHSYRRSSTHVGPRQTPANRRRDPVRLRVR